ncbi:MAG: NADP-dependent 3-hydroxy acid dehydrogenase YdfG [Thermoleophilia bacterium]|nr:NADP-dependent 3-hydroxy acid dehydrogenase YdfG [Thermoleophilia bacterium]
MPRTWFITGTSRGFGREFTLAALERGDLVVATARDTSSLDELVPQYPDQLLTLALDVDSKADVDRVVAQAIAEFGPIDIVVNNAGYGLFGAIEESGEAAVRAQFETNFFGALWVTQSFIPHLREQGSGHIVQISSIGGVAAFPNVGIYNASKWALEAMSEALATEVADFGIKVTLVEPALFGTDWPGSSAKRDGQMEEYQPMRDAMAARWAAGGAGDPVAAAQALLKVVDAENPPLRVLFGETATQTSKAVYAKRLAEWAEWEQLSIEAGGTPVRL